MGLVQTALCPSPPAGLGLCLPPVIVPPLFLYLMETVTKGHQDPSFLETSLFKETLEITNTRIILLLPISPGRQELRQLHVDALGAQAG